MFYDGTFFKCKFWTTPTKFYLQKNSPVTEHHKTALSAAEQSAYQLYCNFLLRPDYSQHALCLPDEDQKGVVVLGSHAPPAGAPLCRPSPHAANGQHFLHGTHWSRDRHVSPIKSVCAISSCKGCLFWASSTRGTFTLKPFFIKKLHAHKYLPLTSYFHSALILHSTSRSGYRALPTSGCGDLTMEPVCCPCAF